MYDSVNAKILLPVEEYFLGVTLPPHLSPFVEETEGDYVPPEKLKLMALQRGEKPREDFCHIDFDMIMCECWVIVDFKNGLFTETEDDEEEEEEEEEEEDDEEDDQSEEEDEAEDEANLAEMEEKRSRGKVR